MSQEQEKRNIRLPAGYRARSVAQSADDAFGAAEVEKAPRASDDQLIPFDGGEEDPFAAYADAPAFDGDADDDAEQFDDADDDAEQFDDDAPEPPPKKQREKKKRPLLRRLLRSLCFFVLICTILGGAALGGYLHFATKYDYLWLELEQLPYRDGTILYGQDRDTGEWVEYARLESTQQKFWVDIEQMPENLLNAFVAIEDKTFYDHHGVSIHRTIYAVLNEVFHAVTGSYFGGGIKQGASTIDQQLIKNLTRDEESSGIDGYLRKIREIYRAFRLDAKYDKTDILEAYLNVISFTGNTAGVGAESVKLFNKDVSELTLEQCASLAAITKNPWRYNPVTNPDNHIERRNYVLYEMWQQGYITEEEYGNACAQPIGLEAGVVDVPETETTSYFTDKVIEDVRDALVDTYGLTREEASNLLYNGGLQIYTTVDMELQSAMEQVMERSYGSYFSMPAVETTARVYNDDGTPAVDENGDAVYETVWETPQAAMVSVDYSGRLRAVVGGIGEKEVSRGLNRATGAARQVGSTMKPIGAYVLALQNDKITWSTPFLDAPVMQLEDEATGEKRDWPANVTQSYSQKNILVADALAESVNTIAVRVGQLAGVKNIYNFTTKQLGISTFTEDDIDFGPMVLGSSTHGVSPYELAGAYMIFGSGGSYTTLHCYERVESGAGRVLLVPDVETTQVIDSDTAYIMNRLLRGVMEGYGTAAGYSVPGQMDSVGKTGTTSDNRDYWFVGLTPYYVTATWYGYDSNFELNVSSGTSAPARAWRAVMSAAQSGLTAIDFPSDNSVVEREYCTVSGGLASDSCRHTAVGYYKADAISSVCTDCAA